jgi:hypothetical protein
MCGRFGRICQLLILGDSPVSELYVPTFRNTVSSIFIGGVLTQPMKIEQSVPKRRYINFRHRGINQKKEYTIQKKAIVLNHEMYVLNKNMSARRMLYSF